MGKNNKNFKSCPVCNGTIGCELKDSQQFNDWLEQADKLEGKIKPSKLINEFLSWLIDGSTDWYKMLDRDERNKIWGDDSMNAKDKQEGGDHYKKYRIQPIEFIHANNIPFLEANVIKYIIRHKDKNGLQDLQKAKHYIDLLIELEYENSIHSSSD